MFMGGAGGGGAAVGVGTDSNAIAGQVLASSDDRTNTLVVSGPTDTLKVVERVVKELDANPAEGADLLYFTAEEFRCGEFAGCPEQLFRVR